MVKGQTKPGSNIYLFSFFLFTESMFFFISMYFWVSNKTLTARCVPSVGVADTPAGVSLSDCATWRLDGTWVWQRSEACTWWIETEPTSTRPPSVSAPPRSDPDNSNRGTFSRAGWWWCRCLSAGEAGVQHQTQCWWYGCPGDQIWRFQLFGSTCWLWALAHLPII